MKKVETRVLAKGFTRDQWLGALEEYTNLDVSFFPFFQSFPLDIHI
jgi:hypothetical protein